MTLKYLKKLSAVGGTALLLGSLIAGHPASAAPTTVNATITTDSSITVAKTADLAYGTWFVAFRVADPFTIHITTPGVISVVGAVTSQAINTVIGPIAGGLTADVPAGANGVIVQMTRTAVTQDADPALTLQTITYGTATEGNNLAWAVSPATVPVTIVTGGTPEPIAIGADFSVTAQPVDGLHTASFDVTFAF